MFRLGAFERNDPNTWGNTFLQCDTSFFYLLRIIILTFMPIRKPISCHTAQVLQSTSSSIFYGIHFGNPRCCCLSHNILLEIAKTLFTWQHYQLPSSTQKRTVTNNQLARQVRSLGLGQPSLYSRRARGTKLQCSGFSETITEAPLYRIHFRYLL